VKLDRGVEGGMMKGTVEGEKDCGVELGPSAMRNNMRRRCLMLLSSSTIMASRMPLRSLSRATQLFNIRPWTCSTCRVGSARPLPLRRGVATTPSTNTPKKPYYVTTPIFYVNAGIFPQICNQNYFRNSEPDTAFSTSTPCRSSLHHGHGRYLEAMAGPPRR
jgi:hypothetical protein